MTATQPRPAGDLASLKIDRHSHGDDQGDPALIRVPRRRPFMVIGATLAAMNTMFSAVDTRRRELATLRALGFKRRAILLSVIIEAGLISLLGGLAGILLALPVNGISTGTTNFQTFSEVAFNFRISPAVALFGLALAVVAGVIGGMLPAIRAARMPITRALREV